jgi:hypothetical protein
MLVVFMDSCVCDSLDHVCLVVALFVGPLLFCLDFYLFILIRVSERWIVPRNHLWLFPS